MRCPIETAISVGHRVAYAQRYSPRTPNFNSGMNDFSVALDTATPTGSSRVSTTAGHVENFPTNMTATRPGRLSLSVPLVAVLKDRLPTWSQPRPIAVVRARQLARAAARYFERPRDERACRLS